MNAARKVVAVLGGSFDPPTLGHLKIAAQCLNQQPKVADEVWVVPCGLRLDKVNQSTPAQRLQMTQLAIEDFRKTDGNLPIVANDIEVRNGESIPTYFLLQKLRTQYPDVDFKFIIGSDLLSTLRNWHEGPKLVSEFKFILISRPNFQMNAEYFPDAYEILDFTNGVSSTEVRNKVRTGLIDEIVRKNLVSPAVQQYIKDNGLYQVDAQKVTQQV